MRWLPSRGELALCVAAVLCAGAVSATEQVVPAPVAPKPLPVPATVASYDLGLMFGGQIEHNGLTGQINFDELIRGLKEGAAGHPMTADQRVAAVQFLREGRDALAERNKARANEFLAHNATEPGIVVMPSGLQYRVLKPGDPTGRSPIATDEVTVLYRASLQDGTEYDRSETHDRPATFRVNTVFKGWQEAFLAMKPGAKWQLFVPPELGYGANSPPQVPPGALLVYELELLKVTTPPDTPLPPARRRPAGVPPANVSPATVPPGIAAPATAAPAGGAQ